jgi:hypothetical protein
LQEGGGQVAFMAALAIALLTLLPGISTTAAGGWIGNPFACACVSADLNEPNDEMETATVLIADTQLDASISRGGPGGDVDVFSSEVPRPGEGGSFRVEIGSDKAEDLSVEVGVSIPEGWEAIGWPGWEPRTSGSLITLDGEVQAGTVLIFVTGERPADYSIRIVWD